MQNPKIGSPLFILRDQCEKDLLAVLTHLATLGFEGVELLGLFGHKAEAVRKMLDDCGMKAVGNHVPYEIFIRDTGHVIEDHLRLGCEYITIGAPSADNLYGGAHYTDTIHALNRLGALANEEDITLLFHNHADEFVICANGKSTLENLLDDTEPDLLQLEPDLGWMAIAGADPAYYLQKYKNRCPIIHFKDYFREAENDAYTFRPVGYGLMNHARLFPLIKACNAVWYIADHDCAYERDPYDDLAASRAYIQHMGLIYDGN